VPVIMCKNGVSRLKAASARAPGPCPSRGRSSPAAAPPGSATRQQLQPRQPLCDAAACCETCQMPRQGATPLSSAGVGLCRFRSGHAGCAAAAPKPGAAPSSRPEAGPAAGRRPTKTGCYCRRCPGAADTTVTVQRDMESGVLLLGQDSRASCDPLPVLNGDAASTGGGGGHWAREAKRTPGHAAGRLGAVQGWVQ
jgi:hypothetical protein